MPKGLAGSGEVVFLEVVARRSGQRMKLEYHLPLRLQWDDMRAIKAIFDDLMAQQKAAHNSLIERARNEPAE